MSGITFIISISVNSLLFFRKTSDFCVLILYDNTLANLSIGSTCVLVKLLGFPTHGIIPPSNRDNLTPSLLIYLPFYFFSHLIAQTKILVHF
jgi:hypothetical protein